MKSFINFKSHWTFRPFWCKIKAFSIKKLQLFFSKIYWTMNSVLCCWTVSEFESMETLKISGKLRWKNESCEPMGILTILGSLWLLYPTKLHLSPQTTLDNEFHLNFLIREIWEKLHKYVKIEFELLSFWTQFELFFLARPRLFLHKSLP